MNLPLRLWGRFQKIRDNLVCLAQGFGLGNLVPRRRRRKAPPYRPLLEPLEIREVPAGLTDDPASALAGHSVNPLFNTSSRMPGGGNAGAGAASFLGDARGITLTGDVRLPSGASTAAGNLFQLLNPSADANPLLTLAT